MTNDNNHNFLLQIPIQISLHWHQFSLLAVVTRTWNCDDMSHSKATKPWLSHTPVGLGLHSRHRPLLVLHPNHKTEPILLVCTHLVSSSKHSKFSLAQVDCHRLKDVWIWNHPHLPQVVVFLRAVQRQQDSSIYWLCGIDGLLVTVWKLRFSYFWH